MVVAVTDTPARQPHAWHFVRLKLRLLRNGLRGQPWRVLAFILGILFGLWVAALAALGLAATAAAPADVGLVVAAFAGTAVVIGWTLIPLLFFGVDETLDPARFALLPVPRLVLARGMLAAAFVGVPPLATLLASGGLVIAAGLRFDAAAAATAAVGVLGGLLLGVVASRAVTSAFAALLRSRRVRDLAAVLIAVLASSVAPLQWAVTSALTKGELTQAVRAAEVLGWTPMAAPYVAPYDVAGGRWGTAAARLALTAATIVLLLWWWTRTIESAMVGASTGAAATAANAAKAAKAAKAATVPGAGAVAALMPRVLGWPVRPGLFGAILAREWRFWWRDARRRASIVSILIASAVLPIAFNFAAVDGSTSGRIEVGPGVSGVSALGFTFAVTMAGTLAGMLLANQFAYDGNAYAAHLLAAVPGRVELRARAGAIALAAVPVQALVVVAVALLGGVPEQLPTGFGVLAAAFGAAVAAAALLSVLAPYPLPDTSNPFAMSSGGASAKGLLAFVAMISTFGLCAPVLLAAYTLGDVPFGPWVVLIGGLSYGATAVWLGTLIAGDVLDRRGPEVLAAVTPRR